MLRTSIAAIGGVFALLAASSTQAVVVDFSTFVIRNSDVGSVAPTITENAAGDGFSAVTPLGGQKVGYGTSAFDNKQLNTFSVVNFVKGVGSIANNPYLNFWVTDGTNYAVIASEDTAAEGNYNGDNLTTRLGWKVFEFATGTTDFGWLLKNGVGSRTDQWLRTTGNADVTLFDFKDTIKLASPTFPSPGVGTGAPKAGYGFNIVFGDTAANFIGGSAISQLNIGFTDGGTFEAGAPVVPLPPAAIAGGALLMTRLVRRRRETV